MKKFVSVLLALAMTLALSVSALAASGTNDNSGTITIDNAVVGKTYTIYEILKLESYNNDATPKAYSYKATAAWESFINSNEIKGVYVEVDGQGYVTWKDGASAAGFAEKAKAFAATLTENQGTTKATSSEVKFENLNLGYYLVVSDLGALCSLDTTEPNVTIKEKNGAPTVDKEVQEGENWGKTNDANIGDTVNFETTINVIDGQPKNYVLHDKMSDGLTFNGTVEVKVGSKTLAAGTDYTLVTSGLTDKCTFEIRFADGTLVANDVVKVTYSAILNEKAVIAGVGNPNETQLTYGNNGSTAWDKTTTYTWQVNVLKYTLVKGENDEVAKEVNLAGAKFTLSKSDKGENPIALISEGNNVYRVAKTGETNTVTEITTDSTGEFTIKGLDSDTYYLTETVAPAGYNVLKTPVKVEIKRGADGTTAMVEYTYGDVTSTGTVKVLNQTGTELPSTGGMGTTIFYVLGGVLMAGAFVLLVVRKRMRTE